MIVRLCGACCLGDRREGIGLKLAQMLEQREGEALDQAAVQHKPRLRKAAPSELWRAKAARRVRRGWGPGPSTPWQG